MKYEELNNFNNLVAAEDKNVAKRIDFTAKKNKNLLALQSEITSGIAYDQFMDKNIVNSCILPKTTKNKYNNILEFDKGNFANNLNSNSKDFLASESQAYNHPQVNENLISQEEASNENKPLLIIDVKLKDGQVKNIKVFEGDTATELSNNFADENGMFFFILFFYIWKDLDDKMRVKLKKLVQKEMSKLLHRIQEETSSLKNTTQNN